MRHLLLLLACMQAMTINLHAQPFSASSTPVATDKSILDGLQKTYKDDIGRLSGSNRKYEAAIYKERYETTLAHFTGNKVLQAPEANSLLKNILAEILRGNPGLDASNLRLFFSRAPEPNAYSMGDGTIFFNIGLFHRLDNESQAAFILCHELSHYFLDHGNKSISSYINTIYSDEFQKKLKSISRQEFGRNKLLEAEAQTLAFRNGRHSRKHEEEADSMAMELLKNTSYDIRESLTALSMLDTADRDKYNGDLELEKRFHFANRPFKRSWLESEEIMFTSSNSDTDKKLADSLKTHPDCLVRVALLKDKATAYHRPSMRRFLSSEDGFKKLQSRFDYEIIAYCYENKAVSRSLYYSLEMLKAFPDEPYLHTMVGQCLNDIYFKQKAHELGTIVDLPGSNSKSDYNQLLQFIQNLRLPEVAGICTGYIEQQYQRFGNNEAFKKVYQKSREIGK